MAQQQMNLNNLTQMLGQGQLSMEQLAQMQRLAAEQEMIRKSLEELNREMKESGQSSRLLGDLEDVAKKMEEVVRELKQNNVNDDLIQKQERILTRLLDATRSMNERDYEKRRESRPGEQLTAKPPAELKLNQDDLMSKIRQDLLKALEEGYSKDYEILIRKYFEALQKQKVLMK
jgi:predicted amino acid-binding ACT domain protein